MQKHVAPVLFAALLASTFIVARAQSAENDGLVAGGMALSPSTTAVLDPLRLRYDEFSMASHREANANLGSGFSATAFSSISTPFINSGLPFSANGMVMPGLNSSMAQQADFHMSGANAPWATDFGSRVSMDVGSGVSLSLIGGVSKLSVPNTFVGPGLGLAMTPQSGTAARVGGGVSFDLGSGSSLSLTGTVSRSSAGRCAGASLALCP